MAEKQAVAVPEKELEAENEDLGLHGKGLRTFQELLADQGSPKESNSGCPVIEKTLCVDTAQSVESPNSRSFSLTTQEIKDVPSSREEYDEIFTKRTVQMDAIDSSLQDFKKLNTLDEEEKLLSNGHKFDDSNIISSINKSTEKCRKEMARENIEATEKEAMGGIEKQLLSRAVITLENSHQNYSQLPIPPPLPNSPSDSWLWRTLPSMSVKNASLRSYLGAETKPQNQVSKDHSINTKWETIVKTTKVHHRHSHHSRVSLSFVKSDHQWSPRMHLLVLYNYINGLILLSFFILPGIINSYTRNLRNAFRFRKPCRSCKQVATSFGGSFSFSLPFPFFV